MRWSYLGPRLLLDVARDSHEVGKEGWEKGHLVFPASRSVVSTTNPQAKGYGLVDPLNGARLDRDIGGRP